ncbi:hypothetical protein [Pedobacter jamesrossensis]|uniref:Lipoprotein n=1 Tax=Pedobacter jamesrossensis TaxID=1908238 RepID=A0ABV8NPF8_9SPHI
MENINPLSHLKASQRLGGLKRTLTYFLLFCFVGLQSCKKSGDETKVLDLDSKNLTSCPADGCSFLYNDRSDFDLVKRRSQLASSGYFIWNLITGVVFLYVHYSANYKGVALHLPIRILLTGR